MKSFLKTIIALAVMPLVSCSSDEETLVTLSEMPQKAIDFVNQYFKEQKINKIEKDVKDTADYYSIEFANGESLDFTKDGQWTSAEALDGKPLSNTNFIQENIKVYLNKTYPQNAINGISKIPQGFEVDLVHSPDEIELLFNHKGDFLQVKK